LTSGLAIPEVPGVSHHHLSVGETRLHVAEAGKGEPLVLLHGWPQHWWMWRELMGPLAERYRVICPDLRGFGWSDVPRSGYEVSRLAADVLEILDQLSIERVRLVGHDVGLGVGYWLCLFHRDRIERFVAMSAWHIWAAASLSLGVVTRPWHIAVLASPIGRLAVRHGMPEHALRAWRYRGSFSDEEVETYAAPLRSEGAAEATVRRYRCLVREITWFSRRHRRLRLEVPTLHLVGEHDPIIEVRPTRHLQTHANDLALETVPGAGHFLAEENPEWVRDRLLGYL
jgi:pimeloyl-ACP methyl ester carboxylesterase